MLNIRIVELNQRVIKYSWVGTLVSVLFLFEVFVSFTSSFGIVGVSTLNSYFMWILFVDVSTNMELLGQMIYTLYSPLFILASIVLLVSMLVLLY